MADPPRVLWVSRKKPWLTYARARPDCDAYVRVEQTQQAAPNPQPDRCTSCGGLGRTLDDCGSCWSKCRVCDGSGKKKATP